jgi:predicted ATP-grasp superfamily ATP-dependent carboligase
MPKLPPIAILAAGSNITTLGLARCFAGTGVDVYAVDTDGGAGFLKRSKYIDRVIALGPRISATEAFVEELCAAGKELKERDRRRVLLFPSEDTGLRVCADHWERLKEYFLLLGDPGERDPARFLDKGRFFQALPGEAPYVPRTMYFADIASLEASRDDLPYPAVVKPARKDIGMSFQKKLGAKLLVVKSPGDLSGKVRALFPREGVVVQECIEHNEGDEVCWWGYRSRHGELAGMTAREMRKYPHPGGTATFMRSERVPQLHEYAREILDRIGFWGLCEMPFLPAGPAGQYKVLELNPRAWLQIGLMHRSGLNAPLLAYRDAMGVEVPVPEPGVREGVIWMSPEYDLLRALCSGRPARRIANLARWLADVRRADDRTVWDCAEPGVIMARVASYPAKLWKSRAMFGAGSRS